MCEKCGCGKVDVETDVGVGETGVTDPLKTDQLKVPSGMQSSFNRLTKQRYERDQKITDLNTELEEYKKKVEELAEKAKEQGAGAGSVIIREDFDSDASFAAAVAKSEARKIFEEEKASQAALSQKQAQENQQKEEDAHFKQVHDGFVSRAEIYAKDNPEFAKAMSDQTFVVPDDLQYAIKSSELGPQIAFYLSQNKGKLKELAEMSYEKVFIAIGKMEAAMTISTPSSNTPPPIPRNFGSGPGISQPDLNSPDMDNDDWFKQREQLLKGKVTFAV